MGNMLQGELCLFKEYAWVSFCGLGIVHYVNMQSLMNLAS
jgi:hypothetical protein